MGVITGTGLANRLAVVDLFNQTIIDAVGTPPAGAGAVITRDRSTSVEQWLTMPADRMSSGKAMTFGHLFDTTDASNSIQHNVSHLDFATASAGDTRIFRRFDGQPSYAPTEDNANFDKQGPNSNGFNIATPYLRHWILTNPNFGALVAGNYGPNERTYIYMVVEVAPLEFRIIGWADCKQLGAWPTPASGFYLFGTYIQDGLNLGFPGAGRSNTFLGSVNSRPDRPGEPTVPGGGGSEGKPNVLYQPDRDAQPRPWLISDIFSWAGNSSNHDVMIATNDPRFHGADHQRDPSAYSGVALRQPMYLYGTNTTPAQKTGGVNFGNAALRVQKLAEIPDAFFCNIRDLDPGTIFVDGGGEKFLVLPLYEKGGLGANFGILLENVDL